MVLEVKWKDGKTSLEEFDMLVKQHPQITKDYFLKIHKQLKKDQSLILNKFICGHDHLLYASIGLCKNCYNKLYKQLKKNRQDKHFECPHTITKNGRNIKSYAMNMCKECCWKRGIYKSYATKCEHKNRPHYVKGYCKQCYKSKFEVPKRKSIQIE